MDRLIALLSVPPPAIRDFIVAPAVLVFSYYALTWIEPSLAALGLSAFVWAVVFSLGAVAAWRYPVAKEGVDLDPLGVGILVGLVVTSLGTLLYVNDPLWCQRFFTVVLLLKAGFLTHALWRAREDIGLFGGPLEGPAPLAEIWGRWKLVSIVALILVNETAIRFGTLEDWIVTWSVAPVVVYCLMHWTILADWWGSQDLDED